MAAAFDEHDDDVAYHAEEQEWLASTEAENQEREWMLDRLAQVVAKLDESARGDMQIGSILHFAHVLKNAEEVLKQTRKELEARAVQELPVGAVVGDAEVVWDSRYVQVRWDELLPPVVSRLSDELVVFFDEDGEKLPNHVIAENLLKAIHSVVGFSSPKRKGLKELGLELDEYAENRAGPVIRWKKPE